MRIIAVKTLKNYFKIFPQAEQALLSWYDEVENNTWNNHNEMKAQYRSASVLSAKRIVFNICGNSYRLIVDVEYKLKIVYVVWFGTHKQYDKINAKEISYDKARKK